MFDSVKRGLVRGGLVVLVVTLCAVAMTAYQMLTAPSSPPTTPRPGPAVVHTKGDGPRAGPAEATISPRGTVWALPPEGTRLGMRFEFREDGRLVNTRSDGRVERGTWAAQGDGFTGELVQEDELYTTRTELKGACTETRLDVRVRITTVFRSGETYPASNWTDWSWGWKRQANTGPGR